MAKAKVKKVKKLRPEGVETIAAKDNPRLVLPVPQEARPSDSVYDADLVKGMIQDIQLGLSLRDTAVRHRLKPETVLSWFNRNHRGFKDVIETAGIDSKRLHLARIHKADNKHHVKSSQWLLERQHRDEFGKTDPNAISVNDLALMSNQILQVISHHLEQANPELVTLIVDDLKLLNIPGVGNRSSIQ